MLFRLTATSTVHLIILRNILIGLKARITCFQIFALGSFIDLSQVPCRPCPYSQHLGDGSKKIENKFFNGLGYSCVGAVYNRVCWVCQRMKENSIGSLGLLVSLLVRNGKSLREGRVGWRMQVGHRHRGPCPCWSTRTFCPGEAWRSLPPELAVPAVQAVLESAGGFIKRHIGKVCYVDSR